MKRSIRRNSIILAVLTSVPMTIQPQLMAQTSTGVIIGAVTDTSGGVLAGASITIANTATGVVHKLQTNSVGFYRSPDLPPGMYTLTFEQSGFKTATVKEISLQVNQTARVDVVAQVGAVSETIEVEAFTPLLQSETSSTGQVIETRAIASLPLNGRNYLDLTKLVPGVSQAQAGRGSEINQKIGTGFAIVVNGQRTENTDYVIDGTTVRSLWIGSGNMLPSVDAIEEFKVQQNSFSAELGFGLAIVNLVSKSGTNKFHGSAFEFLRNAKLDATNYFTNATGRSKDKLQRNQFGGTFGGPIRRNRLFFFGNYEGTRERRGATLLGVVPTLAQRSGDFSGPGNPVVNDPLTRQPFPGGIIPDSRFVQFARAGLKYYPLTNINVTGSNYVNVVSNLGDMDQYGLKTDFNISSKDTLSLRFQSQNRNSTAYSVMPLSGQVYPMTVRNIVLSEIHTFGPALMNELRLAYNYNNVFASQETTADAVAQTEFGLQNTDTRPEMRGLPQIGITGLSGLGGANGGFRPEGGKDHLWQFVEGITWTRGRQTIRAGVDIRKFHYRGINAGQVRGTTNFNGQFSGSAVADFLLGAAVTAGGGQGDMIHYQLSTDFGAFVQDDIHLTSRLTVNLGIRWEYYQPPVDVHGLNRQVWLDLYNTGQFLLASKGEVPPGVFQPDKNNVAPRLGIAWRVMPKTVVRAAFGMFYNGGMPIRNELDFLHNFSPPYAPLSSIQSDPSTPTINLARDVIPPMLSFDIACCPKQFPAPSLSPFTVDRKANTPYVEQWNFGIQHDLGHNLLVDAGYVGSHGIKLWGRLIPNQAEADLNLANPTPIQGRRPFPWIGAVTVLAPAFSSWYQSAQLKVEKRYSNGLLFLASYTFSKNLDMFTSTAGEGVTDRHNLALDKGLSPNNVAHRLVASGVWDVPFGHGRHYGAAVNRFANAALGGWGVNWITTFQTGNPVDIRSPISNNRGGGIVRPNLVCDPTSGSGNRTVDRWFNIGCFVAQPFGAIGNSGRDPVIGPGFANWDLAAFKTFTLMPEDRLNLQFRAEFFNAFNHTQFQGPDSWTLNTATFGKIVAANRPRELQFGLRLVF